jgi:dinuclear metal center YbgI/SA1388 family protein
MTVKRHELTEAIEASFPLSIQEGWDNSGWQIALMDDDHDISHVLVAFEITSDVVREATQLDVQVIVEHHPLFFRGVSSIDVSMAAPDPNGAHVVELIKWDISVYAAHTSFDTANGGMNDALASAFGLTNVTGFPSPDRRSDDKWRHAIGRKGEAPATLQTFADFIAESETLFDMKDRLRVVGGTGANVRTVALCGGAGGDFVPDALREGIDLYITADIKQHEAQWARDRGLLLIDGGHYGTEKIFTPVMASLLREKFGDRLQVTESDVSCDPWERGGRS